MLPRSLGLVVTEGSRMNEISEKPCKRCYESIPLAAHRCPKCQSWQSFWSYLANNPQMWVSLPLVLILIIPLSRVWGGGADFGKYHDQVEVTEAKLQVGEVGSHNGLVTIGWIRNHSLPGRDRKSTRLNSSHHTTSRMPSSA